MRAMRALIHLSPLGLLVTASVLVAQDLPTVAELVAEPTHVVRGRLWSQHVDHPDPRLGVELEMPRSVPAGSLREPRQEFYRHPIMLPSISLSWASGRALRDQLPELSRSSYSPPTIETSGERWIARVAPHQSVDVVVRFTTRAGDLDCIGSSGSDWERQGFDASRLRDWLLARCRSMRVVEAPAQP
jgi:hypothetical protein